MIYYPEQKNTKLRNLNSISKIKNPHRNILKSTDFLLKYSHTSGQFKTVKTQKI